MTRPFYSSRAADGRPGLLATFIERAITTMEQAATQGADDVPPLAGLREAAAGVDRATQGMVATQTTLFAAAGIPGFQDDLASGVSAEKAVQNYRAAHHRFFGVYFDLLEAEAATRDRAMALVAAGQARVTFGGDIEALPGEGGPHAQA